MRSASNLYQTQMKDWLHLAETKWRPLIELKDRRGKVIDSLLETSPDKAALCAALFENEAQGLMNLPLEYRRENVNEDFRTVNVGTFDKFAFPLIRTIYPNLIATELVSVQPMQGPNSLIFFVDARYDSNKSPATVGTEAISPLTGHNPSIDFTSELVSGITAGTGNATAVTFPFTTSNQWLPIRRNSVVVQAGSIVATDDGAGNLIGTGVSAGTINYTSGAFTITYAAAPANTVPVVLEYRYVMEGNINRPKFSTNITSAQVIAETRSLETDWSVEAETDLKALHGLAADQLLMGLTAEQLRYEIDRQIIGDLLVLARANTSLNLTWDYTSPAGTDYYLHQLSFLAILARARNAVWLATKGLGEANFGVCGANAATVIEAMPQFQRTEYGQATGSVFIGTMAGFRFYKDPWIDPNTILVGYKGNDWLRAGYAYCPYVPLWRTPVITLTDMNRRVGLMTRYGTKVINRNFYMTITIQNFGVPN